MFKELGSVAFLILIFFFSAGRTVLDGKVNLLGFHRAIKLLTVAGSTAYLKILMLGNVQTGGISIIRIFFVIL